MCTTTENVKEWFEPVDVDKADLGSILWSKQNVCSAWILKEWEKA